MALRKCEHCGNEGPDSRIEDAPIITCVNCANRTRRGSFCQSCGISLAALAASRSTIRKSPLASANG